MSKLSIRKQISLLRNIRKKFNKMIITSGKRDRVSVIISTNKTKYFDRILFNYYTQTIPNKELIIILNNNSLQLPLWQEYCRKLPDVHVFQLNESTSLGQCLNYAIKKSNGKYIAKFDDDDYYSPNYLQDLLFCFYYTDADIVGKHSHFVYLEKSKQLIQVKPEEGFKYTHFIAGGTHMFKRKVWQKIPFQAVTLGEDVLFNRDCINNNFHLYAADPFNYIRLRSSNPGEHTWQVRDEDFLEDAKFIAFTEIPRPYVSV